MVRTLERLGLNTEPATANGLPTESSFSKRTEHRVRGNGGLAVDAVLEINGEWQAKQDIAGETDPNSGVTSTRAYEHPLSALGH